MNEREIFKQKVKQYPVMIDKENDPTGKAQLLRFKDRIKDLDLNLVFGSELTDNKSRSIYMNALYVTGKQLQKNFYLGESLEEVKHRIMADSEAEDFDTIFVKQHGHGVLTNKKIGRTIVIYAHEGFDELPNDEDAISYAKTFYIKPDISRFSMSSNNKSSEIAKLQKAAIDKYYENHKIPNGIEFINLEKLSKNIEFFESPWVSSDRYDLLNYVYTGSKYGVIFIEDDEIAIHNFSKKELETISKLQDYEFDSDYKAAAKEMAKIAPDAPDFSIDLGNSIEFNWNVIEKDCYISKLGNAK